MKFLTVFLISTSIMTVSGSSFAQEKSLRVGESLQAGDLTVSCVGVSLNFVKMTDDELVQSVRLGLGNCKLEITDRYQWIHFSLKADGKEIASDALISPIKVPENGFWSHEDRDAFYNYVIDGTRPSSYTIGGDPAKYPSILFAKPIREAFANGQCRLP